MTCLTEPVLFLSASTAFRITFPSPSLRQLIVLMGLEVFPPAVLMLSVTSSGLGSPRRWAGAGRCGRVRAGAWDLEGKGLPDLGIQDRVCDGVNATSLALSPKPSQDASGDRPRPAEAPPPLLTCGARGPDITRDRPPQSVGTTAHLTHLNNARGKNNKKGRKTCSSPPAGPFWIWVKPSDPVHATRVQRASGGRQPRGLG